MAAVANPTLLLRENEKKANDIDRLSSPSVI
jgi:hypothetical protein